MSRPRSTIPTERRAKSEPLAVASALKGVLAQYKLDEGVARYGFVLRWREIVGEEIARRTWPECVRDGVLVVAVENSAWAQELGFNKQMILSRLQKVSPESAPLKDVVFYVGDVSRSTRPRE